MAEKTILVSGATGFIGRHALPLLLQKGNEVHAVHFGASVPELPSGCRLHVADLLQAGRARELINEIRPSHLLHLAWEARPGIYWTSETNLDWVAASLELFRAFCDIGGIRAVSAGTCAEYDWATGGVLSELTSPVRPSTLYGTAKSGCAQIIQALAQRKKVSFAWGRVFFAFGPYEYPQRLIPSVIQSLLKGEKARTSSGGQIRDFLYVEEIARAFVELLDSRVEGPVNIASGHGVRLSDMLDLLESIIGKPNLIEKGAIPAAQNEPLVLTADVTRLNKEVGFKQQVSLSEGLEKTVQWWRARTNA